MSKYTFVVDFEDGKEPSVKAGMRIFGGDVVGVAFSDLIEHENATEEEIDDLRARLAEYESAPPAAPCTAEYYRDVLAKISDYTIALRSGGPAPEDLQELSDALEEVTGIAYDAYTAKSEQTADPVPDIAVEVRNGVSVGGCREGKLLTHIMRRDGMTITVIAPPCLPTVTRGRNDGR